ncbi:MAG: pyridoxal phosphate-dependent aminotransferase [Bacteriovorax sp.]
MAPFMEVYDLRIGEPKISEFPSDVFGELHQRKNINCYYPSHGDPHLREMIINKYYEGHSIDHIGITHGTMGALDFIMRANLNPDLEILIPDPGFPPYTKLAEFTGAKIKKYSLNLENGAKSFIDWEQLESLITDKTKLLLINSPHNPTGKIMRMKDLVRFEQILYKHPHLSFIMDEVYRELIYDDRVHFDFTSYMNRGYIVGSFSKMFPLQGARIGWVFTNKANMEKLSPYFNNATGAMSSFGQEIGKSVLMRKMSYSQTYSNALAFARNILDFYLVDYIVPEGAFFIFIKYDKEGSIVCEELGELGVEVVPGAVFGKLGEFYIRVSFAQENHVLKNALRIIGGHWRRTNKGLLQ